MRKCNATDCDALIAESAHGNRLFCSNRCYNRTDARRRWAASHDGERKRPVVVGRRATPVERFWVKVDRRSDGCWQWLGSLDQNSYGQFTDNGTTRAHRWSYVHWRGPIPDGFTLDHLCRNKACVNPHHVEAVTRSENIRRGKLALAAA